MPLVNQRLCAILFFFAGSFAFHPTLPSRRSSLPRRCNSDVLFPVPGCRHLLVSLTDPERTLEGTVVYENTAAFTDAVRALCRKGRPDDAMKVIHSVEESMNDNSTVGGNLKPSQSTYTMAINSHARFSGDDAAEKAQEILDHMKAMSFSYECCQPKAEAYTATILAWSASQRPDAAHQSDVLLSELWSLYNGTEDRVCMPYRATYIAVINAWARSRKSKKGAERAEELLEEMEAYYRDGYKSLAPTSTCVNAVLNAWSKSGHRGAAERCEAILKRMVDLAWEGRVELQPDTVSFNTVMDAIAKSGQRSAPRRTESLLQRMETLAIDLSFPCQPDTQSFNIVINSWAKSREKAAARRAEAILRHMEKNHEMDRSNVPPDTTTYNCVIQAWSKSNEDQALKRAYSVLRRMESANMNADSRTYNSLINVWAKSKHPQAGERAHEILEMMKSLQNKEDPGNCSPDVFTYTSVMDAYAKQGSPEAAERALSLLDELEAEYQRTREERIKPNVHCYTSAINAIARSRQHPQRAEAILDRFESLYASGKLDEQPDSACYNAVINAWGWSGEKGKSRRAYNLYRQMKETHESGKNSNVSPDIVTCNSLLNACAFETADSEEDRAATMKIAIVSFEDFHAAAPKYGWPSHITFSNMLLTIARQMPMSDERLELAEATFWQCCKAGHVCALVITHLRSAVNAERLQSILGSALIANGKDRFVYDMKQLPREWRRYTTHGIRRRRNGT